MTHSFPTRRSSDLLSVLALQEDFLVGRQVVGNAGRQADAEVHVGALGDVAGHARGHLVAGQAAHAAPPVETRRCTKMPGVTTDSGSSSPSATTPDTWAMVHAAAIAINGPKLRRSEEHTSELQSLMRSSYAVFC